MAIGISDTHVELGKVVRSFLEHHDARAAGRALLDGGGPERPAFWPEMAALGWLGLHVAEEYGGSGAGLAELLVVSEELGYATAPGPFLSTTVLSATLAGGADGATCRRWLPGLVDGSTAGALALRTSVRRAGDRLDGRAVVLTGAPPQLVALVVGEDVVLVDPASPGVRLRPAPSMDPTRPSAELTLDGAAPAAVLDGAAGHCRATARALASAEAVGGAQRCVEMAAAYARDRQQFGRPIATFQAVKHHCANMLVNAEMAQAATWDAGAAADDPDPGQLEMAAAAAAVRALPAFVENAELNMQVHGGIGFTWDHDCHVLLRRAAALAALADPSSAAADVGRLALGRARRTFRLELPPEAEEHRDEARSAAAELAAAGESRRTRMIETGYIQPHWPRPWGREASALEQLVIEEEFARAGVERVDYGITGWVTLTIVQHGSPDQVERWVRPTLEGDLVWCQLFSEPDAGSDAAGIRTRGERVAGGWLVTGQKVWTSGAERSQRGLATVRTDPERPKHAGITMMVLDMAAEGVEIRPLREATGNAAFNEVFLDGVFVPDDDVVGPVDGGWTVARATLGNERVSIGGGSGTGSGLDIVDLCRRHGRGDPAAAGELGALVAERQALAALNTRRIWRAVAGAGPGPEGNVTKLAAAEHAQRAADFARRLLGPDAALMEGDGAPAGLHFIFARAMTIAGGTSEITRNQIGERLLGLPRDPLVR